MPSIDLSQSEVLEKISNNVDQIRVLLEEIRSLADRSGVEVNIKDLSDLLSSAQYAGGWDSSNEDTLRQWQSSGMIC